MTDTTCPRCDLLVGLPDMVVLDAVEVDGTLRITAELRPSVVGCPSCGVVAWVKDRRDVEFVDLPMGGRPTRLIWRKRRFRCPDVDCPTGTFTEEHPEVAVSRMQLTTRAGRWVTRQVGGSARSVSEVARELGCDWHTVNDAVVAFGEVLLADPGRFGAVGSLGLDEVLFVREGERHHQHFSTSIVDVERGQLLDVVAGKTAQGPVRWLERQGREWCDQVRFATLDLSATYKSVFDAMVPKATQVADPFHVVRHANDQLDKCRRRVQNETLGHRGRRHDPLFRARRLLIRADERLDDTGRSKLLGLLDAGDPKGEVRMAWHAKETVRSIYEHTDEQTALEFTERLGHDLQDESCPIEVRSLGRTLVKWRTQICAWHRAQVTNGPTEAANNLIKRVKRAAFGFTSFRNYRVRALLYAGKPNWSLLGTVIPG